jgi:hypothetical protein
MAKTTTLQALRAACITDAMDKCIAAGSILVLDGQTCDKFTDGEHILQIEQVIASHCATKGMGVVVYSREKLARALPAPGGPQVRIPSGIGIATPPTIALDNAFRNMDGKEPSALIIDYSDGIVRHEQPDYDQERIMEQLSSRARDSAWRAQGHLVILICRMRGMFDAFMRMPGTDIHTIAMPASKERERSVNIMLNSKAHPLVMAEELTVESLASMTGGLSLDAIDRIRYASNEGNPLSIDTVMCYKKAVIKRQAGGALTIHDDIRDLGKDVAGLPQITRLLMRLKSSGGNTARVLLLGPPGTGKTLCAVAIARAMNTIPISFGLTKSMWVGESERIFDQALSIVEANKPLTLILDECDQLSMGSRTGSNALQNSSSVDASLMGKLLEWLGDVGANNGISVIAMSNNAVGVDPAFRDRLVTIPILEATSAADKAQIALIQLRRLGLDGDAGGIERAFAESSENFTGRQIVSNLLDDAIESAKLGDSNIIRYQDMAEAIGNSLESFGPAEELMSLRAIRYTRNRNYLPWVAAKTLGDSSVKPPAYLEQFLTCGGTKYDKDALDDRIAQLVAEGF